jgi:hypothetical protein
MKIKIDENILRIDIPGLLRDLLIEKYNFIKNKENPTKLEIKFLSYHALAYFQYLNTLSTNEAIRLFKNYILTDGQENKIKINGIEIPLYFDELLDEVTKYLMNHKNIINTISKDGYVRYFSKRYDLNTSDIPTYKILKNLLNIDIYVLAVLKGHLTILYKEIFPFLLEKAQVIQTKD